MKPELDAEWVKAISEKLEVVYALCRWEWERQGIPRAAAIEHMIRELWDIFGGGEGECSSGGLSVCLEDEHPVVTFTAKVSFRLDDRARGIP